MSNSEQIEFWNGKAADTWVRAAARTDRLLAPLSAAAIAQAAVQPGEKVVDVGCGCGTTSLDMADAGAQVWGVDVSAPMLGLARKRAGDRSDLKFSEADASSQQFSGDHDLLFSRFGVMFFDDPDAAFANLRTALKRGGRLCFVCWQEPKLNQWMSVAGQAVAPFLPKPDSPPDPKAPGPFAFADKGYLRSLLQVAGFSGIRIDSITPKLHLADTLDEAVEFQSEIGPLARALAELEGETRAKAMAAARTALGEHMTEDGLHLSAACWLVTARN